MLKEEVKLSACVSKQDEEVGIDACGNLEDLLVLWVMQGKWLMKKCVKECKEITKTRKMLTGLVAASLKGLEEEMKEQEETP